MAESILVYTFTALILYWLARNLSMRESYASNGITQTQTKFWSPEIFFTIITFANGINGYTIDPDNIDYIANKIDLLYEENNLAENGFNKIKSNFSTDAIAKELEQFYSSIINN